MKSLETGHLESVKCGQNGSVSTGRGPLHALCAAGGRRTTGSGPETGPQAGASGRDPGDPGGENPRGAEGGVGAGVLGRGLSQGVGEVAVSGYSTSKERVRRLMREHGLQAPHRLGNVRGPRVHDGTLIPEGPNRMWDTDATQVPTRREGTATAFVAVDHFVGDVVGIPAARRGTHFEALEPIHQGIRGHCGPLAQGVAEGLVLRHDHGPQYLSHAFQQELRFLEIESSPSFVRAPEGNGVAERFIRTLKEQLLWVRTFDTVEELRQALLDFKNRFNRHWLLQRHCYATPAQVRAAHTRMAEAA